MKRNNGCIMSAWQSEVDDGGREARPHREKGNAVEEWAREVTWNCGK